MWVFIFLLQGPIQAPLVISAIIAVIAVKVKNLPLAASIALFAGFYARVSRFTWVYAPGLWVGMLALAYIQDPRLTRKDVPRLIRPLVLGIAGFIGGQFMAEYVIALSSPELSQPGVSFLGDFFAHNAFNQALLWYRLLPNSTFAPGILLALLYATLPLVVWLRISHRHGGWRLNRLQFFGFAVPLAAFLAVGLVASTKIGGGGDLHNLDMFLVSVILVASLALPKFLEYLQKNSTPLRLMIIGYAALIMPVFYAIGAIGPYPFPPDENKTASMIVIREEIDKAKEQGEILFIDQRQLLTFGFIQNVLLVPEYEKKYLMDQAMANDFEYFEKFYQDIANHRFSIIVSEPLFLRIGDMTGPFPEENDAWVTWVSRHLLQYYRVLRDFRIVGIQILVPRGP